MKARTGVQGRKRIMASRRLERRQDEFHQHETGVFEYKARIGSGVRIHRRAARPAEPRDDRMTAFPEWLEQIGLAHCRDTLQANGIDFDSASYLTGKTSGGSG